MEALAPFLQDLFKNLAEILVFLVIAIATAFLGRIKNWWRDRSARRFEKGINANYQVQQLLAETRLTYEADRVCLYQMHNGEYYVTGTSIMKASLTHYVTKAGISNPYLAQAVPTTHMLHTLKRLQDSKSIELKRQEFTEDSFEDCVFTAAGTEAALVTSVRDARRNWIGILCVSWISDPGPIENKQILEYSHQIGEFLSKRL